MEPWNIKQVADELRESYALCQSDFERSIWRVYVAKDCQRILNGRTPTPGEQSILDQYGITV